LSSRQRTRDAIKYDISLLVKQQTTKANIEIKKKEKNTEKTKHTLKLTITKMNIWSICII